MSRSGTAAAAGEDAAETNGGIGEREDRLRLVKPAARTRNLVLSAKVATFAAGTRPTIRAPLKHPKLTLDGSAVREWTQIIPI